MVAREPIIARVYSAQALAPGRRVGGADLRALVGPDLGTGLGGWGLVLRKLAHAAEYAVLGALLARATGRPRLAFALAVLYAISDELHQLAVGRRGAPLDVAIDAVALSPGSHSGGTRLAARVTAALLIDLDGALGDTRPLWDAWLADAERVLPVDTRALPADRGLAANALDDAGQETGAPCSAAAGPGPIYLRPDATTSAALRQLAGSGVRLGAFTDAPAELADLALAQLERRGGSSASRPARRPSNG